MKSERDVYIFYCHVTLLEDAVDWFRATHLHGRTTGARSIYTYIYRQHTGAQTKDGREPTGSEEKTQGMEEWCDCMDRGEARQLQRGE